MRITKELLEFIQKANIVVTVTEKTPTVGKKPMTGVIYGRIHERVFSLRENVDNYHFAISYYYANDWANTNPITIESPELDKLVKTPLWKLLL